MVSRNQGLCRQGNWRLVFALAASVAASCKTSGKGDGASNVVSVNPGDEMVAVLLGSHGDIDSKKDELESYIKVSFQKNVGIPFPYSIRPAITEPAYKLSVGAVGAQYDIIGPTKYRANAQKQVDALTAALQSQGIKGKAYYGFNFTKPFISDVMAQIQKDGIKKIIVFNQGAQCSWASQGENMGDVMEYLHEHPDFDAEVIGYVEYSDDQRFRDLLHDVVVRDAKEKFPGVSPSQVCILMGSHGLPERMTEAGDPAIKQMNDAFEYVKAKAYPYKLYHGFLNDDFIPGAKWASPNTEDVATQMKADGCKNVLMDGRLSFTVNHRATLYDLNYVARNVLQVKESKKLNWQESLTWTPPKVELANHFDGDPGLAKLFAQLTMEALNRKGPLRIIKEHGKPAFPAPKANESCLVPK